VPTAAFFCYHACGLILVIGYRDTASTTGMITEEDSAFFIAEVEKWLP
jgi:hypothetical protein